MCRQDRSEAVEADSLNLSSGGSCEHHQSHALEMIRHSPSTCLGCSVLFLQIKAALREITAPRTEYIPVNSLLVFFLKMKCMFTIHKPENLCYSLRSPLRVSLAQMLCLSRAALQEAVPGPFMWHKGKERELAMLVSPLWARQLLGIDYVSSSNQKRLTLLIHRGDTSRFSVVRPRNSLFLLIIYLYSSCKLTFAHPGMSENGQRLILTGKKNPVI